MILVDTSLWVDHLRRTDERLTALLSMGQVLAHPFITGELALGNLKKRTIILSALGDLPQAIVASDAETLEFIHRHALNGLGIGYIDAHLLASARLTNARLWTRDKRLHQAAVSLKLAYSWN